MRNKGAQRSKNSRLNWLVESEVPLSYLKGKRLLGLGLSSRLYTHRSGPRSHQNLCLQAAEIRENHLFFICFFTLVSIIFGVNVRALSPNHKHCTTYLILF